jgi:hypothetical protein
MRMRDVFAVFPMALAALAFNFAPMAAAADLTGRILLPPGNSAKATVLIAHASLKTNVQQSISNRYPILPARTQIDSSGSFKFPALDSRYLYFGYALAPGCKLQQMQQMDLAAGPLTILLKPAETNVPSERIIHGRIIDAEHHPVAGAVIAVRGTTRSGQMTWPGSDVDFYAVSDGAGNFVICGNTPFAAVDGTVAADGFAEASFEQWPSDAANQEWQRTGSMPDGLAGFAKPLHEITLAEGATLRGRLMQSGKPVPEAEVRLNGCRTGSSCWDWKGAVLTDAQGQFSFANLPPGQGYSVCGTWDLLARGGALPQVDVQTFGNGSVQNVGDIQLESVCDVAGNIHLSDGKPIPHGSNYFLGDAANGDSVPVAIGEDGAFHFVAVPGDKVSMYLRVAGYELRPGDTRLISGPMTNIIVQANMNNLKIEMQPDGLPGNSFR